jgi:hypothetical protein
MDPSDGAPASQPTAAYLSYDDSNLYVAFVAKDDPSLIRARVAKRKQIMSDDRVTINIDTFHDHRHAYWFDVNPYAVQFDGITTDGYGDDMSWEGLWSSEAKITADGYVVLITVPFRTLRFPDAAEQEWGFVVGRFIQRNNEFSSWPHIARGKLPQYVAQFGDLRGLKEISPGRNLQFIPYGLLSGSRYLDQPAGRVPYFMTQPGFRAGVDAKAVIKDALTLDATVNPDFSQIESDEPQVTINQRYEVFFPERRPFFMENAAFFNVPQTLFFSRRIVDPEFGLRLTGKVGRWGIGILAADDRAPGKLARIDDPLYGRRAVAGALSIQRDFWKDSHVRLFATDSSFGSAYNRVVSLDTRLHLKNDFFLTGQAVRSETRATEGGQPYSGSSYFAQLSRSRRNVQYYTTYTDRSPDFVAALGYIPRVDIREVKSRLGYKWWPEGGTIMRYGPAVNVLANRNYRGQLQDWQAELEWSVDLKRLTTLTVSGGKYFELYRGYGFHKHAMYYLFSTEWYKWLALSSTYSHGTALNYYPGAGYLPFLGNAQNGDASLTLRAGPRVRLDESYLYSRLAAGPTVLYSNHIARSKVNYQWSRALSFRAIVDYNGVLPNSSLIALDHNKRLGFDLLMTYLVHPGTAFYVGYTDIYQNMVLDPSRPPYIQITQFPNTNTGRQVFVKLSYLFRY